MARDMMIKRHTELAERLEVERAQLASQELLWPDESISAVADAALRGVFHDPLVIEHVARIDRLQACCHLLEHLEWLMDNLSRVPSTSLESNELRQWLVPRIEALATSVDPKSYPDALRRYRAFIKLFAALATLDSWQSPSSRATSHHIYHRQYVPLCRSISAKFLAMEPGVTSHRATSIMFSSYMAGFNTLLWAFREQDLMASWLVDDKVYFECKMLLEALPDATNIHYVNVHDRRCFLEALQQVKPRVIILDIAPNWHELPILDLYQIFDALEQYPPSSPRFIIFDHSLVGPLFDPSGFIKRHPHNEDVFIWGRSLQKLDVGCLDLCSGGYFKILTHWHRDELKTFPDRLRDLSSLLGTGLGEYSAFLLHPPSPALHLSWRALSFRNGWWLCKELRENLIPCGLATAVHHPGMTDHPAHSRLERDGSLIPPIVFIDLGKTMSDRFLAGDYASQDADYNAGDTGSGLCVGASFGFHRTRIGWWTHEDKVALRIAVGLEPLDELPRVLREIIEFVATLYARDTSGLPTSIFRAPI